MIRLEMISKISFDFFIKKLTLIYLRNEAHRYRKKVVQIKGEALINRKIKKFIKDYAKKRFGKKAYWPYLALYTEMRGQFIEGWIPHDYFNLKILPKINPRNYCYLSDAKTFDCRLFGNFAISPLFLFISGIFYSSDLKIVDTNHVKQVLSNYNNKIVIKEEAGLQGKQVRVIHSSEFRIESLKRNKNYVMQPFIKQYKVLEDLYPYSVNTFRVTTYIETDGFVNVVYVILKFGNNGEVVDNLSCGGNYIFFNSSGEPSNIAYDFIGCDKGERHINTGYLYSDIKIPMFHEVVEQCKEAHLKYPYVRYIGWDVCVDHMGEPKLIEWNAINPGFWCFEATLGPFFPKEFGT